MKTLDSELKEINKKFNERIKEEKEYRKAYQKKFNQQKLSYNFSLLINIICKKTNKLDF